MKRKQKKQTESISPEELCELSAMLAKTIALERTHQGGYKTKIKTEKAISHGNATENAPRARKMPPKPKLEGLELLYHFADHNCGIKDFWEVGPEKPESFTTDKKKISAMWKTGKRQFKLFLRGYIVIDIDRHHKNADGLERFYKIYDIKRLPSALQNISAFPCRVETPNGVHLYFRYNGPQLNGRHNLDHAIEVKTKTITAPIIHRNGKPYVWLGNLDVAPRLFPIIREKIPGLNPKAKNATTSKPINPNNKKFMRKGTNLLNPFNDSMENVYEHICNKYGHPGDGFRNEFCYYFGIAAGKKGFSETEILNYLKNTPAKTDDMITTIQSALKSQAVNSARGINL